MDYIPSTHSSITQMSIYPTTHHPTQQKYQKTCDVSGTRDSEVNNTCVHVSPLLEPSRRSYLNLFHENLVGFWREAQEIVPPPPLILQPPC